MRIGIIGKITDVEKNLFSDSNVEVFYDSFKNADGLIESENIYDIILCNIKDENVCIESIENIRRSNLFLIPVFFFSDISVNLTSDGCYSDNCNILEKYQEILNNIKTLVADVFPTWQEKLLVFLYTRPELTIKSEKLVSKESYYYYPILKVFSDNPYFVWLEELVSQKIFEKVQLIDKYFSCPKCSSISLKFSPHCPECNSLNIAPDNFLHCFTCGFSGPENEFLNSNKLICPNCKSVLKLYGSDYDRLLEHLLCHDCRNVFSEPDTVVTCLSCGNTTGADNLKIQSVYDLKLSEIGMEQAKTGEHYLQYFTDNNNFLKYDLFLITLGWLIKAQERYENQHFQLIGINLVLNNMIDYDFFRLLCKTLYKSIREIDITSRTPDGVIWIIFPFSNEENNNLIYDRVREIINSNSLISEGDEENKKIEIVNFSSNKNNVKGLNANILISKLSVDFA